MNSGTLELSSLGLLLDQNALRLRRMYTILARGRRKSRTVWIREWIRRRSQFGVFDQLLEELRLEDVVSFKNFLRVDPAMFRELVDTLSPRLQKRDTWFRKAHPVGLKVAITLRHLAIGDSYPFRAPHNTISEIVVDVCNAIIAEYAEDVIQTPVEEDDWRNVADLFSSRWQFHHAIGDLDGKHVAIRCPPCGGSQYYNYKEFHSIVLLGLVDADYKFIWVNIGAPGACSDAQIWNQSDLRQLIIDDKIHIPPAEPIPRDDKDIPYFIIGDDAFALKSWLMKPFSRRNMDYAERLFNYRLSRARRVVENAFGILANRFQCLLSTLKQLTNVEPIIPACVCLHNLMRIRYPGDQKVLLDRENEYHEVIPGSWRNEANLEDMQVRGGNFQTKAAKEQRQYLKHYYSSPAGSVPWQDSMLQ